MVKILATPRGGGEAVINPILVNRGGHFGETWLLQVSIANALNPFFVVEADTESDAIDTLLDSEWGGILALSEKDAKDWHENDVARGGNTGIPYLPHQVSVVRCTVNYDEYLLNKDNTTAFENWIFEQINWDEIDIRVRDILLKNFELLTEEFNNDWIDHVEEENSEKSDAPYNKYIAGRTYFDE